MKKGKRVFLSTLLLLTLFSAGFFKNRFENYREDKVLSRRASIIKFIDGYIEANLIGDPNKSRGNQDWYQKRYGKFVNGIESIESDDKRVDFCINFAETQTNKYLLNGVIRDLGRFEKSEKATNFLINVAEHEKNKEFVLLALDKIEDLNTKSGADYLIERLYKENDRETLGKTIEEISKSVHNDSALDIFITMLEKGSDNYVSSKVLEALERMNNKRSVMPLIKMLEYKEDDVQAKIINILGNLHDKRAVKPILKTVENENPEYFNFTVPLGKIGGPEVRAYFYSNFSRARNEKAMWNILEGMRELAKTDNWWVSNFLEGIMMDEDYSNCGSRKCAAYGLGRINKAKAKEIFRTYNGWCSGMKNYLDAGIRDGSVMVLR